MKSLATFILFFIVCYSTYYIMNEKLRETEKDIEIRYKEVSKAIIEEQYNTNIRKESLEKIMNYDIVNSSPLIFKGE